MDPHNAERMILIGCHDAATLRHALVLRLEPEQRAHWVDQAQAYLNESIKYDSTTCAVFVQPEYQHWPESERVLGLVRAHYAQARINQNTVEAIGERQGRNFVANLRRIVASDGLLREARMSLPSMAGRTAIICGAGPSFERSADVVAQHRGPVIAVNTSAGACAQRGIKPHVVVCTESKPVREGIERMDCERSHFAMDLIGHPANWWGCPDPELAGGWWLPQLVFIGTEPNLVPYARQLGMLPLAYGSSCTTAAVSLALACGASKVVLVGQDCAFEVTDSRQLTTCKSQRSGADGRTELHVMRARMYASGTPYEETTVTIDALTQRARINKPTVGEHETDVLAVSGIDGHFAWTTHSMLSFAHWFRDQPADVRRRIVNCTVDGVYIEGIEHGVLANHIEGTRGNRCIYNWPHDSSAVTALEFESRAGKVLDALRVTADFGLAIKSDAELMAWARSYPIFNMWIAPERLRMRRMDGLSAADKGHRSAAAVRRACTDILDAAGD